MQNILVTGGTGYIGSHTVVELMLAGHDVFVVDNLQNSKASVLDRIAQITGRRPGFSCVDLRDAPALAQVLAARRFDAVVHFAGLKAVGDSVARPLEYFDCNVVGSLRLLECMRAADVKTLVFSSSATVYGDPERVPIREDHPLRAVNPYGRTKLMIEDMLRDLVAAEPAWRVALLRYFNPAGAHASGLIGEDPTGVPNNLMPRIAQAASGAQPELMVFGGDYPTADGTGVRDYIHVVDLARGHLAALDALRGGGVIAANLGTGRGYSVLEMLRTFSSIAGRPVPHRIVPRRPGDVAQCFADPSHARDLLGWEARLGLEAMCEDAWRWQLRVEAASRMAGGAA